MPRRPLGSIGMRLSLRSEKRSRKPCPRYVFFAKLRRLMAMGRFLLDPVSEKTVIADRATQQQHSPIRSTIPCCGARFGRTSASRNRCCPAAMSELALKSLPTETDESMSRIQGGRVEHCAARVHV